MCCIPWYTSISGRCGGNDELVDLHKGTRFFWTQICVKKNLQSFVPCTQCWARMHFRKAVQKQIWVQPTAIEDIDRLFYLFACLCNHSDCHVFGRRRCTSIGYVSIPNQRPLVGYSGHCHLAGSWKRQTNAGAPVLLWKGSLHLSGKLIILLESNRIVTSFTLQESATKCVLQGSWLQGLAVSYSLVSPTAHWYLPCSD